MKLENRIDFVALISVEGANPNGDPSNDNRPRQLDDGRGEISDVCIKRKIRNRLQDMGEKIFVQADDRIEDGCTSLHARAEANKDLKAAQKSKDKAKFIEIANKEWLDVRAFGQVFAFKGSDVSVGIRGAVTIQPAFSLDEIYVTTSSITKSTNSENKADGKKASDTMGEKHRVDFGLYVLKGSVNARIAEKNGLTKEEAYKILDAINTLFVNDDTSARPAGSMDIAKMFVFEHNMIDGQYSAKQVFDSVCVEKMEEILDPKSINDYKITVNELEGLEYKEM